jgi:UDP-glucuronate 4-epimerase
VYGPRQRPDLAINKFIKSIYKEEEIEIFGDGQTSRDYTYIDDIVDGIISAIKHCKGYSIFNLGNDLPIKLLDLVNKIASIIDNKPIIKFISKQPGDVESTWADISHTRSALNYNPKVKLTEGLQRQFNWFKSCL